MRLQFGLKSWSAYAPGLGNRENGANSGNWNDWLKNPLQHDITEISSKVQNVPAMLRRRLGNAGKLAASVFEDIQGLDENTLSLFASRHGEIDLTYNLLYGIGHGRPMSPMGFSMAVHNAIGGIYTMAKQNKAPLSAIAASDGLILPCLFEAAVLMQAGQDVLCVIYDAPINPIYRESEPGPETGFGLALLLSQCADHSLVVAQSHSGESSLTESISRELAEFIAFVSLLQKSYNQIVLPQGESLWRLKVI